MLNKIQKKVAYEIPGNVIVSASPGTGKTRSLIARAEYKSESRPKHKKIALITYTNAAADEMSSRLNSDLSNIFVGTIHRFCLEYILRPFGWLYNWKKPQIVSYEELKLFLENHKEFKLGENPIEELGRIKRDIFGHTEQPDTWGFPFDFNYFAQTYYAFLDENELIDFNDILYRSYLIISNHSFVAKSTANLFYEILVDEFQDTNMFQYEMFKIIEKYRICTFFIVGDDKQKLYRFAGAIDNAFVNACRDFDAAYEELTVTYRSTQNIIDAYSCLYDDHPLLENDSIYKSISIPVEIINSFDNDSNNEIIEQIIEKLLATKKVNSDEIAILTNSWMDAFFISRHLRKKYNVVGLGALPHRSASFTSYLIIKSICRFICEKSIYNLRVIRRNIDLYMLENNLSFDEKTKTRKMNYLIKEIACIEKQTNIVDFLKKVKNLLSSVFGTSVTEIDEIINQIDKDEINLWPFEKYKCTISGINGITINTIHQAKGLEYKAVILSGMNEGRIPYQFWDRIKRIRHQLTVENLKDGQAKMYVAVSRARKYLFLLHDRRPSMFLDEIQNACR